MSIEKSLYQTLTQMKYRDGNGETSISSLINGMLKEYLHTYVVSKSMGHMLMSKDLVKIAFERLTDEQIKQASDANAMRYKEGAILEHNRPSLGAYLELIRAFAKANEFDIEISKNPENENHVLIITFRMGDKFTQYLGNTYRILLQEFSEINKMEITATSAYFEYKPKKELVQETRNNS